MIVFYVLFLIWFFFYLKGRKLNNPYHLTMIFGAKGAGKSTYMVCEMIKHLKRGWNVYTDMEGVKIPGVRYIPTEELIERTPEPHSALFLDEIGLTMNNRNFKSFPAGYVDFFAKQRKGKVRVFCNSQAFDPDKKVRDRTDRFYFAFRRMGCFVCLKPVKQFHIPNKSNGISDNPICPAYDFAPFFSWRYYYIPKYFDCFDTNSGFNREFCNYSEYPGSFSEFLKRRNLFFSFKNYIKNKIKIGGNKCELVGKNSSSKKTETKNETSGED